jgi:ParB family chromosome partitioning protein
MLERFVRGIIEKEGRKAVVDIPVDSISVNPYQPRRRFDQKRLEQLAQSIREQGVIQPVIVRPLGNGYELVTGERRLRASKLISNKTIPAIVRELSDQDVIEITFIENLQREQLDLDEEAVAYGNLMNQSGGQASEHTLQRVGKDMDSIQKRLWMLHLPQIIKKAVVSRLISPEQARLIARVANQEKQIEIFETVYKEKLSLDDTRRLVQSLPSVMKQGMDAAADPAQSPAPAHYSRSGVRRLDGCLLLVRDLVAVLRAAGVPVSVTETLAGESLEVSLSFDAATPAPEGNGS